MTTLNERVEGQSAFVLHTRPYRETSALVDFITADYGRICLLVKGVRQAKSKLRIATQSFTPLAINWSGRSDLKTLTAAETQGFLPLLQGRDLCCGLYLNELVMKLLPGQVPSPRLFSVYRLAIQSLADAELQEAILRVFEHRLLDELGVAPSFDFDPKNQQDILPSQTYSFDSQWGFVASDSESQESHYSGSHLLAMSEDDYSDAAVRRTAKQLMRLLLKQQLGDKPLASRALFAAPAGIPVPSPSETSS